MINRMCATTIWCIRKRRKPAENPIVNHRKRNTMVEMIQRSAKIIRIICMHQGCTAAAVAALFSCSHEPMSLSRCDPKCVCVPHSHLLNFLSLKIYLNSFLFASIAGCGELRCSVAPLLRWVFFFVVDVVIIRGNFLAILFRCSAHTARYTTAFRVWAISVDLRHVYMVFIWKILFVSFALCSALGVSIEYTHRRQLPPMKSIVLHMLCVWVYSTLWRVATFLCAAIILSQNLNN